MEVTIAIKTKNLETFNDAVRQQSHIKVIDKDKSCVVGYTWVKLEVDEYWLEQLFQLGRLYEEWTNLPY